jgi:hypothetical protein
MANDKKPQKPDVDSDEQRLLNRRDFLAGLRKWSAAVIGRGLLPEEVSAGWVNGRGSWVNGGGGGWVNRGGTWINGGGEGVPGPIAVLPGRTAELRGRIVPAAAARG